METEQPLAVQVDLWRQRINAGEILSMEEMKAAVQKLRGGRVGAVARTVKRAPKSEAEMMDELDNL